MDESNVSDFDDLRNFQCDRLNPSRYAIGQSNPADGIPGLRTPNLPVQLMSTWSPFGRHISGERSDEMTYARHILSEMSLRDLSCLRILDIANLNVDCLDNSNSLAMVLKQSSSTLTHLSIKASSITERAFSDVCLNHLIELRLTQSMNESAPHTSNCLNALGREWGGVLPENHSYQSKRAQPTFTERHDCTNILQTN